MSQIATLTNEANTYPCLVNFRIHNHTAMTDTETIVQQVNTSNPGSFEPRRKKRNGKLKIHRAKDLKAQGLIPNAAKIEGGGEFELSCRRDHPGLSFDDLRRLVVLRMRVPADNYACLVTRVFYSDHYKNFVDL